MGYIYLLTDKRNEKKYVGKHDGKKKQYFSSGVIPNRILKKHGKDIFIKTILEDNIPDDLLSEKEIFYIKKYNTFKNGYNLTEGGDGGNSWVEKKTEDEIIKISEKKRIKNKGKIFSAITLEKMSLAKKGRKLSEEHNKNIRKSQLGENHPWFGKHHKKETKKKMSQKKFGIKKPKHSDFMKNNNPKNVKIMIEGIEYKSIESARVILNIKRHIIKMRLNSIKYIDWYKL